MASESESSPMMVTLKKIGFVGAGQMAQALGAGIAKTSPETKFVIHDPSPISSDNFVRKIGGDRVVSTLANQEVFDQCPVVFLAVKPQMFANAVAGLLPERSQDCLVVSVMAGVQIETIQRLTHAKKVIRVMPNTPCLIGKGASAIACSAQVTESERATLRTIFESVGLVEFVDESQLDGVTGLSGSGPAYVFSFIEGMIAGGIEVGLDPAVARRLAQQTVLGAAAMLIESNEEPATLRNNVTSPGGTTLAGLGQLDQYQFRAGIVAAIKAAAHRSKELGSN